MPLWAAGDGLGRAKTVGPVPSPERRFETEMGALSDGR